MWRTISYLTVFLLALLLVSCGGKPLDMTPDIEKQGPGLFSGESGTFRILGKPDPADSGQDAEPEEAAQ